MNWTKVTMEWDDNQTQLRDVNANELVVWGGHFGIKRSQLGTSIIWNLGLLQCLLSFFLTMKKNEKFCKKWQCILIIWSFRNLCCKKLCNVRNCGFLIACGRTHHGTAQPILEIKLQIVDAKFCNCYETQNTIVQCQWLMSIQVNTT